MINFLRYGCIALTITAFIPWSLSASAHTDGHVHEHADAPRTYNDAAVAININGRIITWGSIRAEASNEFARNRASIEKSIRAQDDTMTPQMIDMITRSIEQSIAARHSLQLLVESIAESEKVTATQAEMDDEYKTFRGHFPGDTYFSEYLANTGKTDGQLRGELRIDVLVKKLGRLKFPASVARAPVTKAEARAYYDSNLLLFRKPDLVSIKQVVITAENAAAQIVEARRLILDGERIESVAARYTTADWALGPNRDGRLTFDNRYGLAPIYASYIFDTLPVGRLSDTLLTDIGYCIIEVETRSINNMTPFEEVDSSLRQMLGVAIESNDRYDFIDYMIRHSKVEINVPGVSLLPRRLE